MKQKKRLAADILKTSHQKIVFSTDALGDIGKAITRSDIRGLIAIGKIKASTPPFQSRSRARKRADQKRKGRRKGKGRKKGRKHAVISKKDSWMSRIRVQRAFLKELKEKNLVSTKNFQMLYSKCKGGYFRNKRHIKLYMTEQGLFEKKSPNA